VILDESGCSQKPPVRSTWGLRGQTPVLKYAFNWKRISIVGALALPADGDRIRVFLSTLRGSVNRETVLGFLRSLRRHLRGQVIVLWDGLPAHRSHRVASWVSSQRHWLAVERFPSYCPELNPLEYLWENLQAHELANYSPDRIDELEQAVCRGARRIRRKAHLPKSFLIHSGLFKRW